MHYPFSHPGVKAVKFPQAGSEFSARGIRRTSVREEAYLTRRKTFLTEGSEKGKRRGEIELTWGHGRKHAGTSSARECCASRRSAWGGPNRRTGSVRACPAVQLLFQDSRGKHTPWKSFYKAFKKIYKAC